MAAKRIVHYRGQTIRIYEQSYSINNEPVVWVKRKPNLDEIKHLIDLGSQGEPYAPVDREAASKHYQRMAKTAQRQAARRYAWNNFFNTPYFAFADMIGVALASALLGLGVAALLIG